jgi:hypothetical protein
LALSKVVAVSIRIQPGSGLAIAVGSGVLRLGDSRSGAEALWKTPGWSGRSVVWDFRDARFDLESSDIRELAQFVTHHQPDTPPMRVAFVTPSDADFGMARMFDVFREDSRTDFRVFREYDEAVEWANSIEEGVA